MFCSMLSIIISFNAYYPLFSYVMYFQFFAACSLPLILIRSVYNFSLIVSLHGVCHYFHQCSLYFVLVPDTYANFSCMQYVAFFVQYILSFFQLYAVFHLCGVMQSFPYFLELVSFYATIIYLCSFTWRIVLFYSAYPLCGAMKPIRPALNAAYPWIQIHAFYYLFFSRLPIPCFVLCVFPACTLLLLLSFVQLMITLCSPILQSDPLSIIPPCLL